MRPIKNDSSNRLDKLFRDNLRDFDVPSSDGMWEAIQSDMQSGHAGQANDSWYGSAALLLLLITSVNMGIYLHVPSYFDKLNLAEQFFSRTFVAKEDKFMSIFNLTLKNRNTAAKVNHDKTTGLRMLAVRKSIPTDVLFERKMDKITYSGLAVTTETGYRSASSITIADFATGEEGAGPAKPKVENHNAVIRVPSLAMGLLNEKLGYELDGVQSTKEVDEVFRDEVMPVTGFHFGAAVMANNTWSWFSRSFRRKYIGQNAEYDLSFGYAFGITAGYDFTTRFGVQTEWMYSNQNQTFYYESLGQRKHGSLDLKYMHVPVLLKYKWSKISAVTNEPVVMNYVFGFQYSRLQSAEGVFADEALPVTDEFGKSALGLVLGIEYDLFLAKNYYLTVGARGSLGAGSIPAVFKGNNSNAANMLIGLNLGINYLVNQK